MIIHIQHILIYSVLVLVWFSIILNISIKNTDTHNGKNETKYKLNENSLNIHDSFSAHCHFLAPETSTGKSSNGSTIPLLRSSLTSLSAASASDVSNFPSFIGILNNSAYRFLSFFFIFQFLISFFIKRNKHSGMMPSSRYISKHSAIIKDSALL